MYFLTSAHVPINYTYFKICVIISNNLKYFWFDSYIYYFKLEFDLVLLVRLTLGSVLDSFSFS